MTILLACFGLTLVLLLVWRFKEMSHKHHEPDLSREIHEAREEARQEAKRIEHLLHRLINLIENKQIYPTQLIINQGEPMPITGTIKGLAPGQSDTFFITPADVNGNAVLLPAGSPPPTIISDDPADTVVVAADGMSAVVTRSASATVANNLGASDTFTKADGTTATITGSANVPLLTIVPPPAGDPVTFVFSQGAPAV